MFERYLRRYVGRVPITPARVVLFLFAVLITSSLVLRFLTSNSYLGGRYLIYDNPGKLPESGDPQEIRHIELTALKTALTLGHILNRTVILPSLHCATCKESSTTGECANLKWNQCELKSVYNWDDFRSQFENQVKPLHFLSDHVIRERLLTYASPLYVFDSALTRTRTQNILPGETVLLQVPKHTKDELTQETVKELLKDDSSNYELLRFHSLYFSIQKSESLIELDAKLTKAFVPLSSDGTQS